MTTKQLIKLMKNLSQAERLIIAEEALHLIHQDIESPGSNAGDDRSVRLAFAAESLLSDYTVDDELKSFTALDGEDFRATR